MIDLPDWSEPSSLPVLLFVLFHMIATEAWDQLGRSEPAETAQHPVRCQSKPDRAELSVRPLLGFSSLGEGRWGHELQTEIMLHSHQLLHSKTTIVKALKLWFHRGDWWNREGTKVGLIQLHRSQYYSNTTYRLKDGRLWAALCLMDTHPDLRWVGYWDGCRVKPPRWGKEER